jgi:hypothetical protein
LASPVSGGTDVWVRSEHGGPEELQSLLRWLQEEPAFHGRARLVTQPASAGLMGAGLAALHVVLPVAGPVLATVLAAWLTRRRARTAIEVTTSDGRRVTVSAERPDEARAALDSLLGQDR